MSDVLLQVTDLKKYFPVNKGIIFSRKTGDVKAVDGVSFFVKRGETFGLVGESGCGKSTTGRLVMQLLRPTAGSVVFDDKELTNMNKEELRQLRKEIQMVFQDPYASLDPRKTVEDIIMEPLIIHNIGTKEEREARVRDLIAKVGLNPSHAKRYPHEFSGGQRQRIGIARALALEPKLIICDEPVSALDVSIQAQIINLLKELQEEFGYTYIFISHDLSVVKHICDRIGVMYLGKMVESADDITLFANPLHPYTQALFSAIPVADPSYDKDQIILEGDIPSPVNPPSGCNFHTRCPKAMPICSQREPVYKEYEPGHFAACLLLEDQAEAGGISLNKEGDVK